MHQGGRGDIQSCHHHLLSIFRPSGEAQTDRMEDRARGWAVSCRLVLLMSVIIVCKADLYILMLLVSQLVSQFTLFKIKLTNSNILTLTY